MVKIEEIKKVGTGVMFESDVLQFIDQFAAEQQRNRSFVINQIVRQYVRLMQLEKAPGQPMIPLVARPAEPIHF